VRGELKQSQDQAERGYQRFQTSSPEWAWKFRVLEGKAALWRGLFEEVVKLLTPLPRSVQPEIVVPALALVGVANAHLRHFPEAERTLQEATQLCSTSVSPSCGDVFQARGLLASEQNRSDSATQLYILAHSFARSHQDQFLESTALLNLGAESLAQGHFDEAIDQSEAA